MFSTIAKKANAENWKPHTVVETNEKMTAQDFNASTMDGMNQIDLQPDSGTWGVFTLKYIMDAETVNLRDASQVFSPVKATDSTSRYFLMAAADSVKLGMRWLNGRLSVRVEGKALLLTWFQKHLTEIGFTQVSKKYASFHVDLPKGDAVTARKTFGSIHASVWNDWRTRTPDILSIQNKGS